MWVHVLSQQGNWQKPCCIKSWIRLNKGENQITEWRSHTGSLHLNSEMEPFTPKPSPATVDNPTPHPCLIFLPSLNSFFQWKVLTYLRNTDIIWPLFFSPDILPDNYWGFENTTSDLIGAPYLSWFVSLTF